MPHDHNSLGQPIGFAVSHWQSPPRPPREPMEGRTCRLEPLDSDLHAADLFAVNALDVEGRNYTYLPYGPFESEECYRDWMRTVYLGEDPLFHAIIDTGTGKAVGIASYLRIVPSAGCIEVGHIHYSPRLQRTIAAT